MTGFQNVLKTLWGPKHLEGQLTSLKRNGNATQKRTVGSELGTSRVEVPSRVVVHYHTA